MFDFRPNLDSVKILKSIAELKARLRKLKEPGFESLHEDLLLLSRLICTNKKQSNSVENFAPPLNLMVQFVSPENRVVNTIDMTDKKANQKAKRDFKTTRLAFLKEAEIFYTANLSFGAKKDDAISKKLRSIQKDIKLIKSKLGMA
jgi:hypothetical protein